MTVPTYTVPASVRANQQQRAMARRPQPCGAGVGQGRQCDTYGTVLYPCGWRCPRCADRDGLQPVATPRPVTP